MLLLRTIISVTRAYQSTVSRLLKSSRISYKRGELGLHGDGGEGDDKGPDGHACCLPLCEVCIALIII